MSTELDQVTELNAERAAGSLVDEFGDPNGAERHEDRLVRHDIDRRVPELVGELLDEGMPVSRPEQFA